jgi:cobalt-zinc-cadmium efflux system outer membrane protein
MLSPFEKGKVLIMSLFWKCRAWWMILWAAHGVCRAQESAVEWSERAVIERFLAQSPQALELRAQVAVIQAEARAGAVYSNPSISFSLEGAGYSAYYLQASQTVPVSGRVGYLREAVKAATAAADTNREALLWSLRSDLRLAFFRMMAAQERAAVIAGRIGDIKQLVETLRQREEAGEGSRYDLLRAERELGELRADAAEAVSVVAAAGARVAGFLPEGASVQRVVGSLGITSELPDLELLVRRALNARADYRAEQRNGIRYRIEEQAARRLRIPEPVVSAGLERAESSSGTGPNPFLNVTRNGLAFSVEVPLPLLNSGRYEVARYQAEQEQAAARLASLARQIRTEVEGARAVFDVRREALTSYERELRAGGAELMRITQTAYQEGEIGILELLDAYRVDGASRLRHLDLKAGLKEAILDLERAVGEELDGKEVQP